MLSSLVQSGIRAPAWTLHFLVNLAGSLTVATLFVRSARRRILDAERRLEMERDGRTFGGVLARALRKHADRLRGHPEAVEQPTPLAKEPSSTASEGQRGRPPEE